MFEIFVLHTGFPTSLQDDKFIRDESKTERVCVSTSLLLTAASHCSWNSKWKMWSHCFGNQQLVIEDWCCCSCQVFHWMHYCQESYSNKLIKVYNNWFSSCFQLELLLLEKLTPVGVEEDWRVFSALFLLDILMISLWMNFQWEECLKLVFLTIDNKHRYPITVKFITEVESN